MVFKASSGIPTQRPWHQLWLDDSYVNENDEDANVNVPGSVYKSSLANSWNDESNFNRVQFHCCFFYKRIG